MIIIKTCAVLFVRYSWSSLKWTKEEIGQIDLRTRKLMTLLNVLHPRDDIDYMCQEKNEEDYIKKSKERLIIAINNSTNNIKANWDFEIQMNHRIQTRRPDQKLINKIKELAVLWLLPFRRTTEWKWKGARRETSTKTLN